MGKELLGSSYKDPISSFKNLQKFSVENSKVYAVFLSRMRTLYESCFSHIAFHYYISALLDGHNSSFMVLYLYWEGHDSLFIIFQLYREGHNIF